MHKKRYSDKTTARRDNLPIENIILAEGVLAGTDLGSRKSLGSRYLLQLYANIVFSFSVVSLFRNLLCIYNFTTGTSVALPVSETCESKTPAHSVLCACILSETTSDPTITSQKDKLLTMQRDRPHLSITLPRNFTFHYTESAGPKTPEQEPPAIKPQSPHAYRIRRRARPGIPSSTLFGQPDVAGSPHDVPIPTIEMPISMEPIRPSLHQSQTEPAEGYLAPVMPRRFHTAPRTPSAELPLFGSDWNESNQKNIGESISRPMSACSILSDSSDDSDCSSNSRRSLGGSCTSPESDAPDPFSFPSSRIGKSRLKCSLAEETPTARAGQKSKAKLVHWTAEMDKHLWTTYMRYLQDPTVTPFKTLPGSPPPLGVCHRVAREAKRTWRGARATPSKLSQEVGYFDVGGTSDSVIRGESPDTITAERSGSNTPTYGVSFRVPSWPKSGASTRRRLRELCKRKATIAPHYQRLLQSRSPSPFLSSPRSHSRSVRMSSPVSERIQSPFATHDIQLSLTTSTAASMQPNGPLAQLAKEDVPAQQSNDECLNDSSMMWASPAPIPSDIEPDCGNQDEVTELPRLGSPFAFHTWGPSRSRPHLRPTTPRTQSSDVFDQGFAFKSPLNVHNTFPYNNTQKRRAPNQLEAELSPGSTDMQKELLEDLFGPRSQNPLRRVRTRGYTVGDVTIHDRLTALFSSSTSSADPEPSGSSAMEISDDVHPSQAEAKQRLGSPFAGISSRPPRNRGRHIASASLSSYDPSSFVSIEQRLGQTNPYGSLR